MDSIAASIDIIFIINAAGDCISASNAGEPLSLVGSNFADRKYLCAMRIDSTGLNEIFYLYLTFQ